MADTTPNTTEEMHEYFAKLTQDEADKITAQIKSFEDKIAVKQTALIRIYNVFDESMHSCKLKLNAEGRIAWMQEIARVASTKTVSVKQVIDEPIEPTNVEPIQTKKPAKTVGIGQAGEKSGI